jgi:hypothetical protein
MLLGGAKLNLHSIQTNPQYIVDHHRQIAHATEHLHNDEWITEHASKPMLTRKRTLRHCRGGIHGVSREQIHQTQKIRGNDHH